MTILHEIIERISYWRFLKLESRCRSFVIEIADSICNEPERWAPGNCTFIRDDGLQVWTSNQVSERKIWRPRKIELISAERKYIDAVIQGKYKHYIIRDMTLDMIVGKKTADAS